MGSQQIDASPTGRRRRLPRGRQIQHLVRLDSFLEEPIIQQRAAAAGLSISSFLAHAALSYLPPDDEPKEANCSLSSHRQGVEILRPSQNRVEADSAKLLEHLVEKLDRLVSGLALSAAESPNDVGRNYIILPSDRRR
jgi:hypothetical protein